MIFRAAGEAHAVDAIVEVLAVAAAIAEIERSLALRFLRPRTPAFPWCLWSLLVMMLMTPLTAFGPQIVPPGPRMTSIRSISSIMVFCTSQYVPAKSGV